jgi:quinol monooxygenase YgiN
VNAKEANTDRTEVVVMTTAAAKPGVEPKVRGALRDVAAAARSQPGCLEYSVFVSEAEPNVTICHERWSSKAEREAFLKSSAVKTFVTAITGAFLTTPSPVLYDVLPA